MFGSRELWVSLGENCLSDDVLKRHRLKAFSTPFSPSRSNIDHVIAADASEFRGFLDRENLVYGMAGHERVVRSTLFGCDASLFHTSTTLGFEATHHDLIANERHRDSFSRKIDRWNDLRRSRIPVVFLYHHRLRENPDIAAVSDKLGRFLTAFSREGAECRAILIHQRIIDRPGKRCVVVSDANDRVKIVTLQTLKVWGGNVSSVLGRDDDDLFAAAIRQLRAKAPLLQFAFNRP